MITLRIESKQYEDHDNGLQAAADDVAEERGLEGWDLNPRWEDEDSREFILVDVPTSGVTDEQMEALRAMAVNDCTRRLARNGFKLTHAQADALGVDVLDWIDSRLGLRVVETDSGVECTPRVGGSHDV